MYKVAIVTNSILEKKGCGKRVGGGGVVTTSLIDEFSKMPDVELTVIALVNERREPCSFNVILVPRDTISDYYDFFEKANEIMLNQNFDVVITANINELYKNNLLQCHSHRYRLNKTFWLFRLFKIFFSRKKLNYEKNVFNSLTNSSDFIAVSGIIKKDYSSFFKIPEENIKVVYPGCEKVYEEYIEPSKKEFPVFGAVSNSSINKGGHVFLAAAGLLKLTGRKFKIRIIADKYEKDLLLRSISFIFGLEKYVEALPKQDDLSDFYKSIDFFVLPSTNEAFGLVVLESASAGKPSVISSHAGVCEIFDENSGFTYKGSSFLALFNTLKKVYDIYSNDFNDYKNFSKNGYNVSLKYTKENFARNILLNLTKGGR